MGTEFASSGIKELELSLNALRSESTGEQNAQSVIKMMLSLTAYLKARKNLAHPGTLPTLKSLADDLNATLLASLAKDKAQIAARGLATFKSLKAVIESKKIVSDADLEELKAVILSVDWEISNITMKGFDRVLSRLETQLKARKIHYAFLRIMHQIGAHIARHKGNSHRDAVPLLRWVFQQYEQLVRHPDMAVEDQKKLAQENIQAFQKFKRKVTSGADRAQVAAPSGNLSDQQTATAVTQMQSPLEETRTETEGAFSPALSHLDQENGGSNDMPLVTLDDPFADPASHTERSGSAAATALEPQPRDVMGDLFSLKESPADELLDAIHLANIHGPDQENAAMPGVLSGKDPKPGTQEFTTQRLDNDPIPEIEQRLDAFFNLDLAASPAAQDAFAPDSAGDKASLAPLPQDDSKGSFENRKLSADPLGFSDDPLPTDALGFPAGDTQQDLDRSDETLLPGKSLEQSFGDEQPFDSPAYVFDNLLILYNNLEELCDELALADIQDKISLLKGMWISEPDKTKLLELLSTLTQFIHQKLSEQAQENTALDQASGGIEAQLIGTENADNETEMTAGTAVQKTREEWGQQSVNTMTESDLDREQPVEPGEVLSDNNARKGPSEEGFQPAPPPEEAGSLDESLSDYAQENMTQPKPEKGFFARLKAKFRRTK